MLEHTVNITQIANSYFVGFIIFFQEKKILREESETHQEGDD
jgi:hypothetical protein